MPDTTCSHCGGPHEPKECAWGGPPLPKPKWVVYTDPESTDEVKKKIMKLKGYSRLDLSQTPEATISCPHIPDGFPWVEEDITTDEQLDE